MTDLEGAPRECTQRAGSSANARGGAPVPTCSHGCSVSETTLPYSGSLQSLASKMTSNLGASQRTSLDERKHKRAEKPPCDLAKSRKRERLME